MLQPDYKRDVSMGASFNGPWVNIASLRGIGWQVKWVGTGGAAVGSFTFDISNDQDPTRPNLGATTLTLDSTMLVAAASPASNDSSFFFDFTLRPNAQWMRMNYVRTSGTGTAQIGVEGVDR